MQKIKILYLVSTLRRTGPINQLYYIIKYLDGDKFSPVILTLSPEPDSSMLPQFQELNIPFYSLGLSRLGGYILGPAKLKKFVAEHQSDIIHTTGIRADTLSAYHIKTMKRMVSLRTIPYLDYPYNYGKLRGFSMAWSQLRALKKIECLVGCGHAMANFIKSNYRLKLHVIQNGVDYTAFSPPSDEQKAQIRKKLKLSPADKIFISVGDLINRKRPIDLLRAFLKSKVPENNTLLIIGEGRLRKTCEKIAAGNSNICFVGQVNNVSEYLKASDFYISTSASEGLPNVILEALATGLPVFLSNIEPHLEILDFNREAGIIFPVGNVEKIADRLDESIKVDYQKMSKAAISIIHNHLNARNMSLQYQQLYEELYGGCLG
jgi:glycosyltransferase involved in cell wall biosynthesis